MSETTSLVDWQNLLAELRRIADRYGLDSVQEAIRYLTMERIGLPTAERIK